MPEWRNNGDLPDHGRELPVGCTKPSECNVSDVRPLAVNSAQNVTQQGSGIASHRQNDAWIGVSDAQIAPGRALPPLGRRERG